MLYLQRYRVKNALKTGKHKPTARATNTKTGYKSWIDYWMKELKKKRPNVCQIWGCGKKKVVGGHVIDMDDDSDLYILPICKKHNIYTNEEEMLTKKSATMAVITEQIDGYEDCYTNCAKLKKKYKELKKARQ